MKIAVNSRIFQNSETGIPYFIRHLYAKLFEIDKTNEYIFFQTNGKKNLGKTKIASAPNNILGNVFFDNFLADRMIAREKIDIFHGPAHILPINKRKNTKYVVTIHDLSFLVFPDQYSRIFTLYYREAVRWSLKNADAIVADSASTKNDIVNFYGIDKARIRVIPLGVSSYFLQPEATDLTRLIQGDYFFSLTTHPKRKNIYSVLEVLARSKKLLGIKYVIAGLIPDAYLQELKKDISRLGLSERVVLFGYATEEQLRSLYLYADCFIYPSFYEGFGFPILESMICQTPVIASGTSSMSEIMPLAEWCINPNDLEDMQNKMEKMTEISQEERNEIVSLNFNFAKTFRWENTASQYLALYKELG
uniref:glycosyltransferase family 4 protein n=1 Tax=Flavobacterium sp. TaxID=239 RepID=UPI004048922C